MKNIDMDSRAITKIDSILECLKTHGTRKRKTEDVGGNSGDMFITMGQAQSLLAVMLNEGKSLNELCEVTGTPQSTLSRNLLDLGIQDRNRNSGFGLVIGTTDPMDLRRKNYTLTEQGRRMKRDLVAMMQH